MTYGFNIVAISLVSENVISQNIRIHDVLTHSLNDIRPSQYELKFEHANDHQVE